MVSKVLMCSFVNASYDAFCVGVYINGMCMVWEGGGHCNAKYFCCVAIGCGRGGEVDFDGDDISIVPRCCDRRSGGKDYCCGDGRGRVRWLVGVKRGRGLRLPSV